MVSLYSLIIFFFILVMFYLVLTLGISLIGCIQKYWINHRGGAVPGADQAIDARTDRLKSKAFPIAVVLVLFCITPFVIVYFTVFR